MTDPTLPRRNAPEMNPARAYWHASMMAAYDETGYLEPLGDRHWAAFKDDGPTLLVTFETLAPPGAEGLPLGLHLAEPHGWSHLGVIADGPTWWRDSTVYRYFDRLTDDAFLEDFDRVVIYGAGPAGYAACAFSVAAPGATVLALQARATQDPAVAGWDRRTPAARRLDFTDRYGFAPDMVEGTGRVFLVHDPLVAEDAMHAALFRHAFVTRLPCRHLGAQVEAGLAKMGLLAPLVEAAADGSLDAAAFARLWRGRRRQPLYLRQLVGAAERAGNLRRAAAVCRYGADRLGQPRFRRRLEQYAQMDARPGPARDGR